MQLFRSPVSQCLLALFLLLSSSSAYAQVVQGLAFDDPVEWNAAISGTVLDDDFNSLVDVDGNLFFGDSTIAFNEVMNPQPLAWGQLSSTALPQSENFTSFQPVIGGVFTDVTVTSGGYETIIFDLDPALGQLEGLFGLTRDGVPQIALFDGDTPLGILDENSFSDFNSVLFGREFGWVNTTGLNVTRIEVVSASNNPNTTIADLDLSFIPVVVDPPAETCFDQLGDVKSEVESLLATATGNDALYLQCALDCISWTQHDCFWVQPSGDRLSVYGSSVFLGNTYAVYYLQRVADPQSEVVVDQLLDVLECIVDKEIEYAIANGGTQCYIDRAADYAELGDIIDDDFDNQVIATLAYRLAWLNAYYSTY